jgi:hypothetical protein
MITDLCSLGAICVGHYVDEQEQYPLVAGIIVMVLGLFSFVFYMLKFQVRRSL